MAKTVCEVEVPSYDSMLWPTLQALKELGGSGTNQEIDDWVIAEQAYSEEQQSVLQAGGPRTLLAYRLGRARGYLARAGALQHSGRGVWAITEFGRGLSQDQVSDLPGALLRRGAGPAAVQVPSGDGVGLDDWKAELLALLKGMPPSGFEFLCQRLLREAGFTSVTVTGRTGDGGIDGIGTLRVSLLSFQVVFQCKRYSGRVGSPLVRDFRGAMVGRADKGLLISTGVFSAEARKEACRDGAPPIDLIDGDQLCALLKEHNLGVKTALVEQIVVESEWFTRLSDL
ncbi:MAG: restriction endonuclease [Mycobacterium leprae]